MNISTKYWNNYINRLAKINKAAADLMTRYVKKYGFEDRQKLINYAYAISYKYGTASATLSAMMYDAIVEFSGKFYPSAEVAEGADIAEVAKTVNGILKRSQDPEVLGGGIGQLVKRQGADTMLQNAMRDKAQFAWIPSGDTCAYCLMLSSQGWRDISKAALKNGHAEHIHANCNCNYAIRFSPKNGIEGYNPDTYKKMFDETEGNIWQEKVNAMRRENYAQQKEAEE